MIELLETDDLLKVNGNILFNVLYNGKLYLFYAVKRDEESFNIFTSKLVNTSSGYEIYNDFSNNEKVSLDTLFENIMNSVDLFSYQIRNDIRIEAGNKFSAKSCYVTTTTQDTIVKILDKYHIKRENITNRKIKYEKKSNIDSGFVSTIAIIIMGIMSLILGILTIINYLK